MQDLAIAQNFRDRKFIEICLFRIQGREFDLILPLKKLRGRKLNEIYSFRIKEAEIKI